MPVIEMSFEKGIFSAREEGYVNASDARMWADALTEYADSSPVPVVALVDARDVSAISTEARRILASAAETPNVRIAAIATNRLLVTQQFRMIVLLGAVRQSYETHIFESFEEAEQFAHRYVVSLAHHG